MAQHNSLGKWGEEMAREFLIGKGYAIVDQNVKLGHNELDIVAMHGDRMVFVEVKTRSDEAFDPVDALDDKKLRHLCRAAESYVLAYDIPHEVQLDVIIVMGSPETGAQIEHYPDSIIPPLTAR